MTERILLSTPQATAQAAADLAKRVQTPAYIALEGELGAGKTTFVKGFLQGLGYLGAIKSPTFTLIETYQLDTLCVVHADLYRIDSISALETLGFRDYFNNQSVVLVEWASRAADWLPKPTFLCILRIPSNGRGRWLEVTS